MLLPLMMTHRDMIEQSGAYTRDEPVVSLGRTITEVETIIMIMMMMISMMTMMII